MCQRSPLRTVPTWVAAQRCQSICVTHLLYLQALKHPLRVQATEDAQSIELAIETVGAANDDQLTHQLLDYLMGEADGVPKASNSSAIAASGAAVATSVLRISADVQDASLESKSQERTFSISVTRVSF